MENFEELMQRLVELESNGSQRSPKLIAEDSQLMNDLRQKSLARNSTQTVKLSQMAE
jgi:hypothetical protein